MRVVYVVCVLCFLCVFLLVFFLFLSFLFLFFFVFVFVFPLLLSFLLRSGFSAYSVFSPLYCPALLFVFSFFMYLEILKYTQ